MAGDFHPRNFLIRLLSGWSLRMRLLVPLFMAVTPLLIFGIAQTIQAIKTAEQGRVTGLISTASRAITVAEYQLARVEGALGIAAAEATETDCVRIYNQVRPRVSAISNVAIFNKEGRSTCTRRGNPGTVLQNLAWHEALKTGSRQVITPAFYGVYTQDWIFAVLVARKNKAGEFDGSVSLGLYVDKLLKPLQSGSENGIETALIDDTGRVLGSDRFEQIDIAILKNIPVGGEPLTQRLVSKSGGDYEAVLVRLIGANIFAVVSRERPTRFSTEALTPWLTLALPVATLALTLMVTWMTMDGLVLRWINRLSQQANSFGEGRYRPLQLTDRMVPPREIGELAATYNKMAEQIEAREVQLLGAIEQKDAAIREIHHRVKNNLQIVSSFLSLQSRASASEQVKDALKQTRSRINALSIIHQTLYQHEQLDTVSLARFFDVLLVHLRDALGLEELGIQLEWAIDDGLRTADDAIPLALFTLEAVTNAMKYAFDSRGGNIRVSYTSNTETSVLSIEDNGRGSDGTVAGTGLGNKLIAAFARQVRGTVHTETMATKGFKISLIMPYGPSL